MRPDALIALIEYLKADPDLNILVDGRIFGQELPEPETPSMPRACIVVRNTGGPGSRDYLKLGETRIDMFCYGETPLQATEVYDTAADALKNMARNVQGDTLLHNCNEAGGPSATRDPAVFWSYVLSVWMLKASEYKII